MKRLMTFLFLGLFLISFSSLNVNAGDVDILIKKLIEEGILTQSDAQELVKEIQKEAAKEKKATTKEAKSGTAKLPEWVEKMKFKGDLRLRYQGQETGNNALKETHRSRGRVRYRLGIESQVNKQWKAGFGIASGGTDPRSTNQTLQDTFESPDLRIDYAFAQYQPFKWMEVHGGKIINPFWKNFPTKIRNLFIKPLFISSKLFRQSSMYKFWRKK